jgi:hypothetical protein
METNVIPLSSQDSVLGVRAKVQHADTPRLLLLWPKNGRVLTRRLDLVLVQRTCQARGVQLALVTRDPVVTAHAKALDISVFEDEATARRRSWRRGRRRSQLEIELEEGTLSQSEYLEELQTAAKKVRSRIPGKMWARLIPVAVGLLAAAAIAGLFWPAAVIDMRMAGDTQAVTLSVAASPEVSVPNLSGSLPARRVVVMIEGKQTTASTGSVIIPEKRATGEVLLTNLTSRPVMAPVGTIVLTLEEPTAWFETIQAVEAPVGDEGVLVAVRSLIPGSEGNVEAETVQAFAGETGLYLAVTNPEPISGGSDQSSPAPGDSDLRRLRSDVLDLLDEQAVEKIRNSLAEGDQLIMATLAREEIISEVYTPELGSPSDTFELAITTQYSAWVVTEADVAALAQLVLDTSLENGFMAVADTLVVSPVVEPVMENDRAVWDVHAVRQVQKIWRADDVMELTNRTPEEAADWLAEHYPLDGEPVISLTPDWWPRMPFLAFRISINAQGESAQ